VPLSLFDAQKRRRRKKETPKTENEPKTFEKLCPPRVHEGGVVLRIVQGNQMNKLKNSHLCYYINRKKIFQQGERK
jgi:hypothetical protein